MFSQLINPNSFSLSSQGKCSSPLIILWSPLDLLQLIHVFLFLGATKLDAALQVEPCESRVERQNHLHRPAGLTSLDAAQSTTGFLISKHTLLSHFPFFIHTLKSFCSRAALNALITHIHLLMDYFILKKDDKIMYF